jgi:hypothetical protein
MGKYLVAFMLGLSPAAVAAKCVPYFPLMAEVKVLHCEPIDGVGLLVRGEILSTTLVESRAYPGGVRSVRPALTSGERSLLVLGAPNPECPTSVPSSIIVLAAPRCGEDTRPLPERVSHLPRVTLESDPSRWVPVAPGADG